MADSILSQAEIDALLSRGGAVEPHAQLTTAFKSALVGTTAHFQVLMPHTVQIEGPYVEQVQQTLDVLFMEDAVVMPAMIGEGVLFAVLAFTEAQQFADYLGGGLKWAVQTIFEGWIQHLADSLSEVNGRYMPYQLKEPVRLSRKQLGQMEVEAGSLLVRHAVCWSKNCIEVCFFIPIATLGRWSPHPSEKAARGTKQAAPAARRTGKAVFSPPLAVRTAVFTELSSPDDTKGDLPLDLVEDVLLDVVVELGHTTMTLQELMELEPHTTFALQKPAGDPVEVLVSGNCIAKAEVTVVNDNFGIRILDIVPEKDRIPGSPGV